MFKNFKAIAVMRTPVCMIEDIILDSIISAAKAKEILQDQFYAGENVHGSKEMIDEMLGSILDKKYGVYCTSIGFGRYKESTGSWAKKWEENYDDLIDFVKTKNRVDIGAGTYKNYHMPLVLKSYERIEFFVRGNMEEVSRLLREYISFLGKKASQGYGQIKEWIFEEIEDDRSVLDDMQIMRPIPGKEVMGLGLNATDFKVMPTIPPYWRNDCKELCAMPKG